MRRRPAPTAANAAPLERTVLFSDVVRSTALVDEFGDAAWLDIVDRHAQDIASAADAHAGVVHNFMGDGFMIVFERPSGAVACAVRLQRGSTVAGALGLRIGIDHGEVYPFRDTWLVGRTIHVASRLTDLCPDGGIAISGAAAARASDVVPHRSVQVELVAVRGLSEPCLVHVVDPAEFAASTAGHPSARPTASNAP
jgi:class 3 adenylate cyclase